MYPCLCLPEEMGERGNERQAFVRMSSRNIGELARNVVYHRRRAMKSAVELAVYEITTLGGRSGEKETAMYDSENELLQLKLNHATQQLEQKDQRISGLEAEAAERAKQSAAAERELLEKTRERHRAALRRREGRHAAEVRDLRSGHAVEVAALREGRHAAEV